MGAVWPEGRGEVKHMWGVRKGIRRAPSKRLGSGLSQKVRRWSQIIPFGLTLRCLRRSVFNSTLNCALARRHLKHCITRFVSGSGEEIDLTGDRCYPSNGRLMRSFAGRVVWSGFPIAISHSIPSGSLNITNFIEPKSVSVPSHAPDATRRFRTS